MAIFRWLGIIASCIGAVFLATCAFLAMIAPYVLRVLILALIVFGLWKLILLI